MLVVSRVVQPPRVNPPLALLVTCVWFTLAGSGVAGTGAGAGAAPTAVQPVFLNPLELAVDTDTVPNERPPEDSATVETADQPPRFDGASVTGANPLPELATGFIIG